jgi:hypothetical protein
MFSNQFKKKTNLMINHHNARYHMSQTVVWKCIAMLYLAASDDGTLNLASPVQRSVSSFCDDPRASSLKDGPA